MVIKNLYREEEMQNIKRIRQGARGVVIEYRAGCPYILLNYAVQDNGYRYDIPGGGVEAGESLEECCVREVREETGYQVEILSKQVQVNEFHGEIQFVNTYFICRVVGRTKRNLTEQEAEETGYQVEILSKQVQVNEFHGEIQFVNTYFICRVVGRTKRNLTEQEAEMNLTEKWIPFSQAKAIFSEYPMYKENDFFKYEVYLREYTAISCIKEEYLDRKMNVRSMRQEAIFSEYPMYKENDFFKYEVYLREYTAISCIKEEYLDRKMNVRSMRQADVDVIMHTFLKQGWHPRKEVYENYWNEQEEGKRDVFVAEVDGKMAGYITLLRRAKSGPFAEKYPELKDFNVFQIYQNNGIGWMLMDEAEKKAKAYGDYVTLAVGLHSGYGTAQRMYIKRGYVPDGSGGWMLMDEAEKKAKAYGDYVTLAVGLHSGYGTAQRMYIKRGYVPDGSGVWYKNKQGEPYTVCCNDDDLILYMAKEIKHGNE